MSQLEYDITEFVINNLETIREHVNSNFPNLECFKDDVVLIHEIKLNIKTSELITYLSNYFEDIETILLICTPDFVNLYL